MASCGSHSDFLKTFNECRDIFDNFCKKLDEHLAWLEEVLDEAKRQLWPPAVDAAASSAADPALNSTLAENDVSCTVRPLRTPSVRRRQRRLETELAQRHQADANSSLLLETTSSLRSTRAAAKVASLRNRQNLTTSLSAKLRRPRSSTFRAQKLLEDAVAGGQSAANEDRENVQDEEFRRPLPPPPRTDDGPPAEADSGGGDGDDEEEGQCDARRSRQQAVRKRGRPPSKRQRRGSSAVGTSTSAVKAASNAPVVDPVRRSTRAKQKFAQPSQICNVSSSSECEDSDVAQEPKAPSPIVVRSNAKTDELVLPSQPVAVTLTSNRRESAAVAAAMGSDRKRSSKRSRSQSLTAECNAVSSVDEDSHHASEALEKETASPSNSAELSAAPAEESNEDCIDENVARSSTQSGSATSTDGGRETSSRRSSTRLTRLAAVSASATTASDRLTFVLQKNNDGSAGGDMTATPPEKETVKSAPTESVTPTQSPPLTSRNVGSDAVVTSEHSSRRVTRSRSSTSTIVASQDSDSSSAVLLSASETAPNASIVKSLVGKGSLLSTPAARVKLTSRADDSWEDVQTLPRASRSARCTRIRAAPGSQAITRSNSACRVRTGSVSGKSRPVGNIVVGSAEGFSFLSKPAPAKPTAKELEKRRRDDMQRKREREEEALKKRDEIIRQRAEADRLKREQRQRNALELRQKKEVEQRAAQQRRREETERRQREAEEKRRLEQQQLEAAKRQRRQEELEQAAARRKQEEAEQRRKYEELENKRRIEEVELKKRQEEAELKRRHEEAEQRKKLEEMEQRRRQEEAEQRRKLEEALQRKKQEELEQRKRLEAVRAAQEASRLLLQQKALNRPTPLRLVQQNAIKREGEATKPAHNTTFTKEDLALASMDTSSATSSYDMTPRFEQIVPAPLVNPDNYNINDLKSDDDTDDESRPQKQIPKWAQSSALRAALISQDCSQANVGSIFDPRDVFQPVKLEVMFTVARRNFFKRTSSACWDTPPSRRRF